MPPKSPKLPQAKLDAHQAVDRRRGAWRTPAARSIAAQAEGRRRPDVGRRGQAGRPAADAADAAAARAGRHARRRRTRSPPWPRSPWAPLVAVGGQKQVLLYNSDTLDLLGVLPFPEGVPHVLKFSRNGSLLLAGGGRGGKSGKVVVWNVATGERIFEVGDETDAVLAADISADQTQIALGGPARWSASTRPATASWSARSRSTPTGSRRWSSAPTACCWRPATATAACSCGRRSPAASTSRSAATRRRITDVELARRLQRARLGQRGRARVRLWEMENGNADQVVGRTRRRHGGRAVYPRRPAGLLRPRPAVPRCGTGTGRSSGPSSPLPDVALRVRFTHDGGRVIAGDWTGAVRPWEAKDGRALVELPPNPLGSAERLEAAVKDATVKQTATDQALASLKAADVALQQATSDLAAAQKASADATVAAKTAQEAAVQAKPIADAEQARLKAAQDAAAARDVLARAYTEAATKVKAAADATKNNPALAEAAARAKATADTAAADLAATQKLLTDALLASKNATEALAKAQQTATAAQAALAQAGKNLEAIQVRLKNAQAKVAADRAAVELTTLALKESRERVQRLKDVLSVAHSAAK